MIRKCYIFLLIISLQANAQLSKNIDSLFLVKNYLLEISNTVNIKENPKRKLIQLNQLIKTATQQKSVFERNIIKVIKNKKETEDMNLSLNLILQSLILYKSDYNRKPKPCGRNEAAYLNKNISILVDKIYYYCERTKREQAENTKINP